MTKPSTDTSNDELGKALFRELRKPDDSACQRDLARGVPVYFQSDDFPNPDEIVKEYPSGRKELIKLDNDLKETVVRVIVE